MGMLRTLVGVIALLATTPALATPIECENLLVSQQLEEAEDAFWRTHEHAFLSNAKDPAKFWGPALLRKAAAVFNTQGTKYKRTQLSSRHKALQILPDKNGTYLERLAYSLKQKMNGCKVMYAPGKLIKEDSGAMYLPAENIILIPHTTVISDFSDALTLHEIKHAVFENRFDQGYDSLFIGWAESASDKNVSKTSNDIPDIYDHHINFDELATYALELKAVATDLNRAELPLDEEMTELIEDEITNLAKAGSSMAALTMELMREGQTKRRKIEFREEADATWAYIYLDGTRKFILPLTKAPKNAAPKELEVLINTRMQQLAALAERLHSAYEKVATLCSQKIPTTEKQIETLLKAINKVRQITLSQ